MERISFKKLSPLTIHALNALGAMGCALARIDPALKVTHHAISSYDGAEVRIRVFEPSDAEKDMPCLVYYHGGAFAMRATGSHLQHASDYALGTNCKVVFVHYRLALKHPFPRGVEDCYSALLWVHSNAQKLGIDPNRLAVGGDSAGGCLAAAVALMARDRQGPALRLQMLIYPALDVSQSSETAKSFVDVPIWNSLLNAQMWQLYLRDGHFGMLQYASPTMAQSLHDLPPAYIETAEFDCLRDEGISYAHALEAAGVEVHLEETKGTVHAYDGVAGSSITRESKRKRLAALREAWGTVPPASR
jgi:acetyl esterase/lipase